MANTRNFNRSFSGGEISPEMFGRIDADKYQTGASKMLNMIVKPQGPAKNRPGFEYVAETKTNEHPSRLIRFRYSVNDSIVIELGNQYMRFYKNGGAIPAGSPPALKRGACTITNAVPDITFNSHLFVVGDQVSFSATVGNIIAGTIYYVKEVATNTFKISLTEGGIAVTPTAGGTPNVGKVYYLSDIVSSGGYNFYARQQVKSATSVPNTTPPAGNTADWWHMPNGVYEIPSPYDAVDVFDLTYSQSNDVMTFAHPDYGVKELRRYGDTDWEIVGVSFDATCLPPIGVSVYGKRGAQIAMLHVAERNESTNDNKTALSTQSQPNLSIGDKVSVNSTGAVYLDDEMFIIRAVSTQFNFVEIDKFETGIQLRRDMHVKFVTANRVTVHDGVNPTYTTIQHGLSDGAVIYFPNIAGHALPVGLSHSVNYTVTDITDTSFRIKDSAGTLLTFGTATVNSATFHRIVGGFIQPLYETVGIDNSYKITAIHEDTTESVASSQVSIKNNIYSSTAYNLIAWDASSGASKYNIYKQQSGIYGYIGGIDTFDESVYDTATLTIASPTIVSIPDHELTDPSPITFEVLGPALPTGLQENTTYFVKRIDSGTNAGSFYLLDDINGTPINATAGSTGPFRVRRKPFFVDDNISPDMGIAPPIRDPDDLNSVGNYPRAVGHFEQRRCFGGTGNDPQSLWMSRSGTENDFSYSIPVKDDDRVEFEVAARELNTIRHVVPMQNLVLLTDTAEWRVTSVNSDAITPNSVSVRPQSYIGANGVQPEMVNNSLVFCAARGGHVRELGYNWQAQSFVTGDLSLRSAHLFDNYELTDMTYTKSPLPILWFVSTSGKLLGLTYAPEEQIAAWHQHETDGQFISCASIPEQEEDRLYVVVKRTVSGTDHYYIERMAPIEVGPNIADAFYVDSGITKEIGFEFSLIDGLEHLEGKTVSVLADGIVYTKVVTDGAITLDIPAMKAHVGLPYQSDLQTLPITIQVDGFGQGRNYNVNKAWVRVFQTAGVKIGPSADKLVAANPYATTPQLQESTIQVLATPSWQEDGQVYIRQTEPLPMTVVGLTFEVSVGG